MEGILAIFHLTVLKEAMPLMEEIFRVHLEKLTNDQKEARI
jgi:hypothetical protein